jgi:hypothetical protein
VAVPADRNAVQKEAEKKLKIQAFGCRDRTKVDPEMYDYTSFNCSHWNSNEKLKEKSGSQKNIRYIHYRKHLYLEHHT